MKFRLAPSVVLYCALSLVLLSHCSHRTQAQPIPNKTSNANRLSSAEQDVLNEINQARLHPAEYASNLEGLKPFFKGKEYSPQGQAALSTTEGWDAVEDAIRFLRATQPQSPLTLSHGLCLAALAHVKDQSGTGATGHKGLDNGLIEQRVRAFGTWQGGIGENLSYGSESARERVMTWLIDDGFASRGHRKRLLSGDYKVAGLSCGPHPEFGTMCVITLAGGFSDIDSAKQPPSNQTKSITPIQKPKRKKTARRV